MQKIPSNGVVYADIVFEVGVVYNYNKAIIPLDQVIPELIPNLMLCCAFIGYQLMYVSMLWNNLLWTIKYQGVNNNIILLQMKFHVTCKQAYLCRSYNECQIIFL